MFEMADVKFYINYLPFYSLIYGLLSPKFRQAAVLKAKEWGCCTSRSAQVRMVQAMELTQQAGMIINLQQHLQDQQILHSPEDEVIRRSLERSPVHNMENG